MLDKIVSVIVAIIFIFIGGLILLGLYFGAAAIFGENEVQVTEEVVLADVDIYSEAIVVIKENLKAPATAVFPAYSIAVITEISPNVYSVLSYVDSENSFGAKVRSDWFVQFSLTETRIVAHKIVIGDNTIK